MNPKISIIMPVFNSEEYLDTAIQSVLAQTEKSFELIIVDDGSTDQGFSKLQRYAKNDRRIKLLQNKISCGVSVARNSALKVATGRWLSFIDSDDWLHPETLGQWIEQAENEGLDFLIGNGFQFSDSPTNRLQDNLLSKQAWGKVISGREWIVRSVKENEWPHYVWLQCIRRDLINQTDTSFPVGMVHEDIPWTLNLALNAKKVGFCQIPFYGYRINPVSIMRSPTHYFNRAKSYIVVINALSTAAQKHRRDKILRSALLQQANRESGHLMGLLRKKLDDPLHRNEVAKQFLDQNLGAVIYKGAKTPRDIWRAIKFALTIKRILKKKT